jgi:hypothetical protein
MRQTNSRFYLWVAGVALCACATQTGLGRATTLAPGVAQFTPALELSLVSVKNESSQGTSAPWVLLGVGYHRGVSERVQLGARIWGFGWPNYLTTLGVAFDAKFQLYRGEKWHVALAPSLKYHAVALADSPWNIFALEIPLLLGFNFGKHQLVFGLRATDTFLTGRGTNAINALWVGAHMGVSWRVHRSAELMPEIGLLYSPVPFNGETADANRNGASIIHVGLGVSIENTR